MNNDTAFEKCVVCGKETNTLINTPINKRTNYIIGVGEVCSKCMLEVYCNVSPFGDEGIDGI